MDSIGTGTGSGYASIEPTSVCPALSGALPGNFTVTVPRRRGTTVRSVSASEPSTTPFGSGKSTIKGTITIQVG